MLNITKGIIDRDLKVVAYGSEGIGKTTFAAFPEPLFIDTEGGTAHGRAPYRRPPVREGALHHQRSA